MSDIVVQIAVEDALLQRFQLKRVQGHTAFLAENPTFRRDGTDHIDQGRVKAAVVAFYGVEPRHAVRKRRTRGAPQYLVYAGARGLVQPPVADRAGRFRLAD